MFTVREAGSALPTNLLADRSAVLAMFDLWALLLNLPSGEGFTLREQCTGDAPGDGWARADGEPPDRCLGATVASAWNYSRAAFVADADWRRTLAGSGEAALLLGGAAFSEEDGSATHATCLLTQARLYKLPEERFKVSRGGRADESRRCASEPQGGPAGRARREGP